MAFSAEIKARLGLDVSKFQSALANADTSLRAWSAKTTGGVGDVSRSVEGLRKLFMAGGVLTAARAFFQGAIEHARQYQGEVDSSIEATKRFGDTLDKLKVTGAQWGVAVIGAVEKAGFGLASLIYGTDAAAEAYTRMDEEARKALDAERAKKMADAQAGLAKVTREIAFKEADAVGKILILTRSQVELKTKLREVGEETVEGQKLLGELAQSEHQIRQLSAELAKADAATAKEKADAEAATNKELEAQKQLRDELVAKIKAEKAEIDRKVAAETAAVVKGANAAAQAQGFDKLTPQEAQAVKDWVAGGKVGPAPITRSGNIRDALGSSNLEQSNWLVDGKWRSGSARSARDFEGVSLAALEKFITERESEAAGIRQNFGTGASGLVDVVSGGFVRNLATSVIEQEIRMARAEMDRRRLFDGVDRAQALASFTGDPLAFDRLYEAAQSQRNETKIQTDVLRQLQDGQRRGFADLAETLKARRN